MVVVWRSGKIVESTQARDDAVVSNAHSHTLNLSLIRSMSRYLPSYMNTGVEIRRTIEFLGYL